MNIGRIHFQNRLEKWAHSAWSRLELTPACDLGKVSDFLGIEYRRETLSYGVLGVFVQRPDNSKLILIASALPFIHQRRIWAHEIGHALILGGLNGEVECHSTVFNRNERVERECDEFAMHLLMPEIAIRNEVHRLGHNTRTNNRLGTLAGLFEVSTEDMARKLRELKL